MNRTPIDLLFWRAVHYLYPVWMPGYVYVWGETWWAYERQQIRREFPEVTK